MTTHRLQYHLHQLDRRHSHKDQFKYYLGFSSAMTRGTGPVHFNNVMTWCIQTWGWSAEINQTAKIQSWTMTSVALNLHQNRASGILESQPDYCNPNWSWTNRIGDDLRIYLRGDAELAFFQLAHAIDQ